MCLHLTKIAETCIDEARIVKLTLARTLPGAVADANNVLSIVTLRFQLATSVQKSKKEAERDNQRHTGWFWCLGSQELWR
jgi:hypothetical protein